MKRQCKTNLFIDARIYNLQSAFILRSTILPLPKKFITINMKSKFGISENTITTLTESGKALQKRVFDISLVLWILIIAYDYSFVIDAEGKISPTEEVFHILFNISAAIAVFVTYRFGRKKRDLKYATIYLIVPLLCFAFRLMQLLIFAGHITNT